jgi:ParB-like chromosome segregation protein Spo0J
MLPSPQSPKQSILQDFSFLKSLPLSRIITRGTADTKYQNKLRQYHNTTKKIPTIILQKHPIDTDIFFVVAGEQGYFFAKEEGLAEIKSYVISVIDHDLPYVMKLLPEMYPYLHCLEQAYVYNFLLSSTSFTQEELSEIIPVGRSTISRILKLTQLPHILQHDLLQNQLRVSLAKEFSTIADLSLCMKLYALHQKKNFTVIQLREEIKKQELYLKQRQPTHLYNEEYIQNICTHFFKKDCNITKNIANYTLEIQFTSLVELQLWIQEKQDNS